MVGKSIVTGGEGVVAGAKVWRLLASMVGKQRERRGSGARLKHQRLVICFAQQGSAS